MPSLKYSKECTGKKTHLYIISSTAFNDDNWLAIVDYFEKKGIQITVSTSLEEARIHEKVEELAENARNETEERKKKTDEEPK